jgi:hypothetical protein
MYVLPSGEDNSLSTVAYHGFSHTTTNTGGTTRTQYNFTCEKVIFKDGSGIDGSHFYNNQEKKRGVKLKRKRNGKETKKKKRSLYI